MRTPTHRLTRWALGIGIVVVLGAGLSLSIGLVGWWDWLAVTGHSRIRAIPSQLDFQAAEGSPPGSIDLILRNDGTAPARVLDIATTCGCTLPQKLVADTIPPGDDLKLVIQVTPPSYGLKKSSIIIRTDSVATPVVHISLNLQGQKLNPPYMSRWPEEIRVQSPTGQPPAPQRFHVTCIELSGEPWLTGFDTDADFLEVSQPVRLREQLFDEQTLSCEYEATVTFLTKDSAEANQIAHLRPITHTEPSRPLRWIRVAWSQVDALRAVPSSVLFMFRPDGESTERARQVTLISSDDSEWSIQSISSDADWLSAEGALHSIGTRHQLRIKAEPPVDHAITCGRVRISTDHPLQQEITVDVTATNRRD